MTVSDHADRPNGRILGVCTLAMMNVAAIVSLRNMPLLAAYGFASVTFYIAAALVFFIPSALVSAELASGWPQRGGVYVWVTEAFGPRWGFLAIWLQWIASIAWFPVVLAFTATTLAYALDPALATNRIYTVTVVLIILWGVTLANLHSFRASVWISTIGVMAGTIIPALLIIVLGAIWLLGGRPTAIAFTLQSLLPTVRLENIVFFSGVLVAVSGMELSAAHAREVKNPQRNYPRAILLATVVILAMFILGSLSIAVVVPKEELSLMAGLMQAFTTLLGSFGLDWAVPAIAILITAGSIALVNTWVLGPLKGLLATAEHGSLPPLLTRVNRAGMPVSLLLCQAILTTLASLVFLFTPSINSSYWLLIALTAQSYLVMYVLMFAAAIRLRHNRPGVPRLFRVPGGRIGMVIIAGAGLVGSLFAIIIGYVPPAEIDSGNIIGYELFLIIGLLALALPPLIIHQFRRSAWRTNERNPGIHRIQEASRDSDL